MTCSLCKEIQSKRLVCVVMTLYVIFGCAGCRKEKPVLVPARGTITVDGKRIGNISIQALPDVAENTPGVYPTSYAISQEDGTFTLKTADNLDGAVPGAHKLILVDLEEERPEQGTARTRPARLDPKYAVAGEIKIQVEAGKPIEIVIP